MNNSDIHQLLRDTGALLRFQAELGLGGLDLPETILLPRPGPSTGAEALEALVAELGSCQRCGLSRGRTHIVFGAGNPRARLLFIGEGPGEDEDLEGKPFVGAAGQLLDKMIAAMGLSRSEVFIANVVKCRPPGNRDPGQAEVAACEPFLRRQIEIIKPEVIVALGRCAAQTLLETDASISALRGRWQRYAGIPLMPTFHPAHLLRHAGEKKAAWQDLQQVMKALDLEDPRRRP